MATRWSEFQGVHICALIVKIQETQTNALNQNIKFLQLKH